MKRTLASSPIGSSIVLFFFINIHAAITASPNPSTIQFNPWGKSISSILDTVFMASPQNTVATTNSMSKRTGCNKTAAISGTDSIYVSGRCFLGPDTTQPLDSGLRVYFCIKPVQPPQSSESPCDQGSFENWYSISLTTGPDGKISGLLWGVMKGSYFILVHAKGCATQWWDGKKVTEQPTAVSIAVDTIKPEFHFETGCTLRCKISLKDSADQLPSPLMVSLVDPEGLNVVSETERFFNPAHEDNLIISGIPIGQYRMTQNTHSYENPFYNEGKTAASATILTFTKPGQVIDSLTWVLRDEEYHGPNIVWDSMLVVKKATVGWNSYTMMTWYPDYQSFFGTNTNLDSAYLEVITGGKFISGMMMEQYSPATKAIYWYPGSFLRSQAETLTVQLNEHRTLELHDAYGLTVIARLPLFTDTTLSFCPIITEKGLYKSLGASPYIDSVNRMTVTVSPGTYGLWNIPFTEGYKRTQGWGAFGIDSLKVEYNGQNDIGALASTWNTRSIEGTVKCGNYPLIACFDTLGRVVSMSQIDANGYLKSATGPRGRFFNFTNVAEKPYTVGYAINFLKPGRYTLVKVEKQDSTPAPFVVNWYGGLSYTKSILTNDDVTLLQVPANVTWITIDSGSSVVTLPLWESSQIKQADLNLKTGASIKIRLLGNGRVLLNMPTVRNIARLRVFGLNGRIVEQIEVKNGSVISLPSGNISQVLVFEIKEGHYAWRTQMFICR